MAAAFTAAEQSNAELRAQVAALEGERFSADADRRRLHNLVQARFSHAQSS